MNEFKEKRGEFGLPRLAFPLRLIQNPLLSLFLYFIVFAALSSIPVVLPQRQHENGDLFVTNGTDEPRQKSSPGLASEYKVAEKMTQNQSHPGMELVENITAEVLGLNLSKTDLEKSEKENKSVNSTNQTEQNQINKHTDILQSRIVNKCCPFHQRYENNVCVDMEEGVSGQPMMMTVNATGIMVQMKMYDDDQSSDSPLLPPEDSVLFKLKISMPDCEAHQMTEKIIHMDKVGHSHSNKTSEYRTLESSSLVLSTLGYLIWQDSSGFMNTLPSSDFCMDQVNETSFVALMCKSPRDDKKPLVRKCCPPDNVLDIPTLSCSVSHNQWTPFLFNTVDRPLKGDPARQIHYIYGLPNCSVTYFISPRDSPMDKIYTLVNGSLITKNKGREILHSPDTYCIDGSDRALPATSTFPLDWSPLDQIAVICFPEDYQDEFVGDETDSWKYTLYAICEFISVFFLALTAIVYIIGWQHQNNIHSWLQFAYVNSCLVSFLLLGIVQLTQDAIHNFDSNLCEAMGSVIHFAFLSAFFWMTSMNFDLWWTFSGCRPLRTRSKVGDLRRFCLYALFSWGCAGVIAGTGLTLDCMYRDDPDSTILRPRFGERNCYFFGYEEQLPYFYGPLGCLLVIDLIFFLHTVYSLYKLQQDTRFATQQSSRQEKKRFLLFVKLFVVMGVLWIFEVLSWTATVYNKENKDLWENIFIVFDVINASQGVWIFIIFICKPNTCRQLEAQFKKFTTFLEEKRGGNGIGQSTLKKERSRIMMGLIILVLPIAQSLRTMFSFCGRRKRTMVGRRHTSRTTTMTSTFDKSRKTSDTSTTTSMSMKDPGAYELDIPNLHM